MIAWDFSIGFLTCFSNRHIFTVTTAHKVHAQFFGVCSLIRLFLWIMFRINAIITRITMFISSILWNPQEIHFSSRNLHTIQFVELSRRLSIITWFESHFNPLFRISANFTSHSTINLRYKATHTRLITLFFSRHT